MPVPSPTVQPCEALHGEDHVATILGVRVKTLQAWRVRGAGPAFIRVGRLVRYRPSDLQRWIESRRVPSTSEAGR